MLRNLVLLGLATWLTTTPLLGQEAAVAYPMEQTINRILSAYEFTDDNQFRLAAYAEMKGQVDTEADALVLDFGYLGTLSFYQENCLLKTFDGRMFFLTKKGNTPGQITGMNERLDDLLDHIFLLGNQGADPKTIAFVDKYLARKNLEPFYKIYVRHILIRYGRYDEKRERVEFHTDWLPEETYASPDPTTGKLVKKPIKPMRIKLDKHVLRGYFVWSGGTVYIEDVDRDIVYATGEEYSFNVGAFKAFANKLFTQTTQYFTKQEQKRLSTLTAERPLAKSNQAQPPVYAVASVVQPLSDSFASKRKTGKATRRTVLRKKTTQQPVLYDEFHWIPMMLGIMRVNNINVGDADVLPFLIDQPYFPRIYDLMTEDERARVDKYRDRFPKADK